MSRPVVDRPGQKDLTGRRGRPPSLFARNLSSHSRATPTFCSSEATTRNNPPIDQSVDYPCCHLRKIKGCPFWAFVSRQDRRQPRREHITLWEPKRPPCPNFLSHPVLRKAGHYIKGSGAHAWQSPALHQGLRSACLAKPSITSRTPERMLGKAQHYIKDSAAHAA